MAVATYPFPARNASYPHDWDIISDDRSLPTTPEFRAAYGRAHSEDARLQRLRYLTIEEELERAYRYVTPAEENATAFSFKFAEIIRAAANAYEIFSRTLYAKFYNNADEVN